MNKKKTCAFTGHREVEKDFDLSYLKECVQGIIDKGYDSFLCGMAWGFDLLAARTVLELKENNPQIKLIACVPCPGQEKSFPLSEKQKYGEILALCDEVRVLSDRYYKGCMYARDRYMVDNSDILFAYDRKHEGGTYYTITYAVESNKKIFVI
ncbi:MAG: DUF1273 domain-containing protein [Clostridia bacterium]|nr:DUF1273 domain-containing protein [Clostridia bacterium]